MTMKPFAEPLILVEVTIAVFVLFVKHMYLQDGEYGYSIYSSLPYDMYVAATNYDQKQSVACSDARNFTIDKKVEAISGRIIKVGSGNKQR